MKKKWFFIPLLFFLIVVIIGVLIISKWNNTDKTLPVIPEHTTYADAVGDKLTNEIIEKANDAGCKGFLLPIDNIDGEIPEGLKDDLTLALAAYSNWQILVTKDERTQMRKRKDEIVSTWGNMLSGRDIEEILVVQKNVDRKTNFSAKAEYIILSENNNPTRKIILKIDNVKTETTVINIPIAYTDGVTIANWKRERENKKSDLESMERRAEVAKGMISVFGIITLFVYLVLFLVFLFRVQKSKKRKKAYLDQIEKRESLIDNGHYTAALELADNYLTYFPDDVEIKAFRERLMIFCGHNTKKAEEAYVHAAKLKAMLDTTGISNSGSLSQEEISTISSLVPYHKNLKESYSKYLQLEDKRQADINSRKADLQDEIEKAFHKREIQASRGLLKELTAIAPDSAETQKWRSILQSSEENIVLRKKDGNRLIYLFKKSEVIIGRLDEGNAPDIAIENNRISRKHIKLTMKSKKFNIEDLASANGTFVNGNAVNKTELKQDDTVNLGKVLDFRVINNNGHGGIARKDLAIFMNVGRVEYEIEDSKIICERVDDLLILDSDDYLSLHGGDSITINSEKYTVEELK